MIQYKHNEAVLKVPKHFQDCFVRITDYLLFLLLQTNHIHRIHTHTILHNLKMQVETCAVAGIAYITYNPALPLPPSPLR